jgi:hypothetical protein
MPPPHPHTVNPQAELLPGLWEVMEKTLAKAPADRPDGARALRALLAPFLLATAPIMLPEALGTPAAPSPKMGGSLVGTTLPPIAAGLAAQPAVATAAPPPVTSPPVSKWPGEVPPSSPPPSPRREELPPRPDVPGYDFDDDEDDDAPPARDDVIVEEALIEVLNGIFGALEDAVGPMADFVLKDSLGAMGLGALGPPDAMSHSRLLELVELASQSVPASKRDVFRVRARRTWER